MLLCTNILALEIDDTLLAKVAARFLVVATDRTRLLRHYSGKQELLDLSCKMLLLSIRAFLLMT